MTEDDRIQTFIGSFDAAKPAYLEELESRCIDQGIPIIRRQSQSLLRYLIASSMPERLLEIGTAAGFSALFMASVLPDLKIDTIENYEKHINMARSNISKAGMQDRIRLIEGDAMEVLEKLVKGSECYDMIFMDAAKGQYLNYLQPCKILLKEGGILVSDNVLFDGDIVQSRFAVRRRDRTIHARMREFLHTLSEDEEMVTTILPIGDGMTLSVKRSPNSVKAGG